VLTVGDALPAFESAALLKRAAGAAAIGRLGRDSLRARWLVLLYWPRDFAWLCPAERDAYARLAGAFARADTEFVAATLATPAQLLESWRAAAIREPPFDVLSDADGELAQALGIDAVRSRGIRASFVVDPRRIIRWVSVSEFAVSRSLREIEGVLRTLQGDSRPARSPARSRAELISMCAWCRRMRDDEGWHAAETYIARRTGADFTHGICPDCVREERVR
jgi:peroxiredoxin (alkyl hydroperoxide reductase subunit C)